ncbi:MAG: inosose dehydratase [Thermoleophilaceae bacterium]|jgi:inosose dehydratase|nr:inosose dehydratase [Thermoleophilaceae bacterium]
MALRLATGPVSWGVDFADDPHNPPWPEVLDGIARTGLGLTELGPLGYLPRDAATLKPELARRGLGVAGSFVFQPFEDPARRASALDVTCATCELIAGVGGTHVVLIQAVTPERAATAGDPARAERLSREGSEALVEGLHAAATIAAEDYGLRPVLHNHVGSALEFDDELDAVLEALPGPVLGLCLDSGHAEYADIDLAALLDRWGERVDYLHLKDVRADVRDRSVRERTGFWAAIAAGVFCPLGEGAVDFELLLGRLEAIGFDGPVTIEQDRRPGVSSTPEQDVAASVSYLETVTAVSSGGQGGP